MAFEASTPFAVACLKDKEKSRQSLAVLRHDAPVEGRAKELFTLARSWNVAMTANEAYQVVAEYDRVIQASGGSVGQLELS